MKYYKITNKRLSLHKKCMDVHETMDNDWRSLITSLTSLKNDRGVRLCPDFSQVYLGDNGPTYLMPRILAVRFKAPIQLKAIREKMWVQPKPGTGVYVLNPNGHVDGRLRKLIEHGTKNVTIFTLYKNLFGWNDVPFAFDETPEDLKTEMTGIVKKLCDAGTDPVVLLVPRFFVTNDDIAVLGLPDTLIYSPVIQTMIEKKWMTDIDEEEFNALHENRKPIIRVSA